MQIRSAAQRSAAQRSRAEQSRAEQSRAEQGRAGQSRAEQGRAGQSRAEQGRAGQSRAEQGRAGQSRAEHSAAEQSRAQRSRAEQSRPQQSRAEQSRAEHSVCSMRMRRHLSTAMGPSPNANGRDAELPCQGLCHNRRQALQHNGKASCFLKSLQPRLRKIPLAISENIGRNTVLAAITEKLMVKSRVPLAYIEAEGRAQRGRRGAMGVWQTYGMLYRAKFWVASDDIYKQTYKPLRLKALPCVGAIPL